MLKVKDENRGDKPAPKNTLEDGARVHSTPGEGAEYIAVCLHAFSPETVNRD